MFLALFFLKISYHSLFMTLQIMCHMGTRIGKKAYIFKKQRFVEVIEREIEDRKGMNWLSLILILGGLNGLFSLLFLTGILFTWSVTWHHNTSLIYHRGSPRRHQPSPAVPCSPPHFSFIAPGRHPLTSAVCGHPTQSFPPPYSPFLHPKVF